MRTICIVLFSCWSVCLHAQNLVPNPGFEEFQKCPSTTGTVKDCKYWYDPVPSRSSVDYFHECGGSVPNNFAGQQAAHGGEGYIGMGAGDASWEEFIEVELSSPLQAGMSYKVSFWISRGESFHFVARSVGVLFSTDKLGDCFECYRKSTPDIGFKGDFSDEQGWIKLEKTFIATGGEKYLTIGYFDPTGRNKIPIEQNATDGYYYYFVDDVEVVPFSNGEP